MDKKGSDYENFSKDQYSERIPGYYKKMYKLDGKEVSVKPMHHSCFNTNEEHDNKITYEWTTNELSPFHERNFSVKLIIAGESDVGKTALVERFLVGNFSEKSSVTLGVELGTKVVKWGPNTSIDVQLWDIKGNRNHKWIIEGACHNAHVALVVYDASRIETLYVGASQWVDCIKNTMAKYNSKNIPMILIANKCDHPEAKVNTEFLSAFCYAHDLDGWYVTSAKEDTEIDTAMTFAIRAALQTQIEEEEKRDVERGLKLIKLGEKTKKSCF